MRRTLCALLFVCLATAPLLADEWLLDFETDIPEGIQLRGARLTSERKLVLDGKRSLLADFTGSDGSWHEFLNTKDVVLFEKGKKYVIRFDYGVVSSEGPKDRKVQFYSTLKSTAGKGDIHSKHWQWHMPAGWQGTISHPVQIPEDGGYKVIIGVEHSGAMVIDNVRVSEAQPSPAATELKVKTRPSPFRRSRRASRGGGRDDLNHLLHDMLIIVLNEGAGAKASQKKDKIANDLVIDFVDWNRFGPLAKQFGVRSTTGGCEYQEYYSFEGHLNQAERERIWKNRYKIFGRSGFVVTLDNTFFADDNWGEGGYFTCHNGSAWHRHFMESLIAKAETHLGITQDNLSCSVFNRLEGCYCPGCERRFRIELKKRQSSEDLAKVGITDMRNFTFRDYALDHGLFNGAGTADAIAREYMKFQFISGLDAWADAVSRCKQVGRSQRREMPIGGNQINIWGTWPYASAISQFCDFIEIEELEGIKDKVKRRTMQYKLGLASGHHQKPVWVRGPVVDATQKETPMLSPTYWTVHFAEALANGGIREFSLGINQPWTGKPETKDYMDDPKLYQLYVDFARWMREHRSLLTHRDSAARVGVVYSLPTLIFRQYLVLGCGDEGRLGQMTDVAEILERNHIPYDMLILGHPEIWDDTQTLKRMQDQYDMIILPGVDAMSDDQVEFFRQLAEKDLVLLADRPIAYDENLNPRTKAIELDAAAIDDDKIVKYGQRARVVEIEAHEDVSVNVWQSCDKKSFDVHLLNYDADVRSESINTVSNVPVRVKLPRSIKLERCVLSQFGQEDQTLEYERDGQWIEVTVPKLEAYAIVSFTDENSIEMARAAAEQRRAADREYVKQIAHQLDLY